MVNLAVLENKASWGQWRCGSTYS